MKAILIFLGFVATISILSRSNPDAVRTIAPTPTPVPPAAARAQTTPHALATPRAQAGRPQTTHSSRLEVSGPLGEKKKHGRSVLR